jgi:molybdopterin-guanine dinucleotide biosynthesis protein A
MTPVAGAVLAGGRSSRMGRDKALVAIDGRAMATRVATAIGAGGCRPVVMIGGDVDALGTLGFEVVPDRWPGEGPLGAIVTALMHFGAPTLVAACDLPWLDEQTVASLCAVLADVVLADVVLATTDRDEPLCACWMPSSLPHLSRQFDDGERAVHRALRALRSARVPVSPAALRNVNAPADLPPL